MYIPDFDLINRLIFSDVNWSSTSVTNLYGSFLPCIKSNIAGYSSFLMLKRSARSVLSLLPKSFIPTSAIKISGEFFVASATFPYSSCFSP